VQNGQPIAAAHDPISPEVAVRLLLHAGLLTSRDIVTSDVRVEPIAARNRSLRVRNPAGRGLFLKQAEPTDPSAAATLAREAAFYAAAAAPTVPAVVRTAIPELVSWDADRALLILELVLDACNAHELDDADGPTQFPRIGTLLGATLAAFHGLTPAAPGAAALGLEAVPAPWILDLCRPDPGILRDVSPAQLEVTRQAQASTGIDDALTALQARWAPHALIHGDLKWGNVLVRAPHFIPDRIWIVDWEYGGWGDPSWDLGSALHAFVADCIHAAVAQDEATPAQVRAAFDLGLPRAREQMRLMWEAYGDASERTGARADLGMRDATVRAAGARLLQSAWEWCHGQWQPPRDAVLALQLALNLLRAPLPAAAAFLGLAPSGRRP
jgi:Phosphotransferase enzyme family